MLLRCRSDILVFTCKAKVWAVICYNPNTIMLRRLQLALILLALIFIVGIAGYVLIEGWSFFDALYMTVITIATVGYGEVKPLSPNGRTFTIFLIILGMGILLFCISTFTAFLVEGELSEILRRRKMEKHTREIKEPLYCRRHRTNW